MSSFPKKAFVLAAGFGTRLQPMTHATPKPLMPIWNEPMLAHVLRMLEKWGVAEAVINAHHLADEIENWVENYTGSLKLSVTVEAEILGTGGALRPLESFFGKEPFWLINGDIAASLSPEPLLEAFEASGRFAAVWLENKKGPRTVEMDHLGRITNYRSPTPGVKHTYTLCGVHLLTAAVLNYLPEKPFCSIVDAYDAAMYANRFVRGVVIKESYWNDGGTLEDYLAIHRETRSLAAENKPGGEYYAKAEVPLDAVIREVCRQLEWPLAETAGIPLGRRGSDRTFWRLVNGRQSVMAIHYELSRAENRLYAADSRFLAKLGLRVPKILLDDEALRVIVMEDCGDDSLERRANAAGMPPEADYLAAIDQIVRLHTKGLAAARKENLTLEAPFDNALYTWELALFEEHFARKPFPKAVKKELARGIEKLLDEETVLVHRDFQSSNVIFKGKKPYLIDFQGMRAGAAAYDLASLLFDPYAAFQEDFRQKMLTAYNEKAQPVAEDVLAAAAVQRLIQALGAFGRLTALGKKRFAVYIPRALENLKSAAETCGYTALLAYLESFIVPKNGN